MGVDRAIIFHILQVEHNVSVTSFHLCRVSNTEECGFFFHFGNKNYPRGALGPQIGTDAETKD